MINYAAITVITSISTGLEAGTRTFETRHQLCHDVRLQTPLPGCLNVRSPLIALDEQHEADLGSWAAVRQSHHVEFLHQ